MATSATGTGSKSGTGFSARLQGASLWDLVQMECQSRGRGVFRVDCGSDQGLLFVDGGRILHAQTRRLLGEPAALEILSWESGSFERCEREWPRAPSIQASCESLLLRAAQRRDESGATNLVAFPHQRPPAPRREEAEPWEDDVTRPTRDEPPRLPGPQGSPAPQPLLIEPALLVRLAPGGEVLEAKGATEEIADVVAYVTRLAALVGELLGLDRLRALECATKDERRFFLYVDDAGVVVALRPARDADLALLRGRIGL